MKSPKSRPKYTLFIPTNHLGHEERKEEDKNGMNRRGRKEVGNLREVFMEVSAWLVSDPWYMGASSSYVLHHASHCHPCQDCLLHTLNMPAA
jgi:hypothetical protein